MNTFINGIPARFAYPAPERYGTALTHWPATVYE